MQEGAYRAVVKQPVIDETLDDEGRVNLDGYFAMRPPIVRGNADWWVVISPWRLERRLCTVKEGHYKPSHANQAARTTNPGSFLNMRD